MDLLVRAWPLLEEAVPMTLFLGLSSFCLGSLLGLGVAFLRLSTARGLRWLAFAYVSIFRGTPLLVQILLIYFGLPRLGLALDPLPSAIAALTLFSAAYLSENFRAGILSVDKGQWEAADSLGMDRRRAITRIILPQALRIALPPLGSRLIALMKDTSLASAITVVEVTRVAEQVGAASFRYLEMFLIAGAIYWIINQLLTVVQMLVEQHLSKHLA
ncbi:amino acid ABC transporter permease [Bradyrhizobium barranii subsp. apii]|uniref:Putative glutamine transport system permease protein GlnP n=1 Tax=Bradyrhizobium barranii subsp. apii TaxID=2819348 RepID=A0A8T5V5D7_9BRAD|nr:amino acid ABC transporter permease [Bradyrhizobium barranii]UPT84637.1 amino acid ABC transporter permease [Bradyrhizobium barranii subsp. apii]UPT93224.1 amino acid ABC transporter permease [Bradyrhizobium barranii subsp. apii]